MQKSPAKEHFHSGTALFNQRRSSGHDAETNLCRTSITLCWFLCLLQCKNFRAVNQSSGSQTQTSTSPSWSPAGAGVSTSPTPSPSSAGSAGRGRSPAAAGPSSSAGPWRRAGASLDGWSSAAAPESEEPSPVDPQWAWRSAVRDDLEENKSEALSLRKTTEVHSTRN